MKTLTVNHPLTRAYFVKSGVIFKINTDIYSEDECLKTNGLAVYADPKTTGDVAYHNEEKVPHFTVTETETSVVTNYFLDSYINPGDSFDGSTFEKVLHEDTGDVTSAFTAYYNSICQAQLERYIMENYNKSFDKLFGKDDDFITNGFDINKLKKIGIPVWIISQNGKYTIDETQYYVLLNPSTFENIIKEGVKKEIYNTSVGIANKYGFDLTTPSKYSDIDITKKS